MWRRVKKSVVISPLVEKNIWLINLRFISIIKFYIAEDNLFSISDKCTYFRVSAENRNGICVVIGGSSSHRTLDS